MEASQPAQPSFLAVSKREVAAAGGLITRRIADDGVEMLLVHRPKYDDWSFPKGKVETGESDEEAAVREVREETGFEVSLGAELDTVRYVDGRGRPKRVRYWLMTVVGGRPAVPNAEVDALRWLAPELASTLLTYSHDQELALRLGVTR
jgi:8-oxo-dGTP pyrophosphatase MutT (NUDIX family)